MRRIFVILALLSAVYATAADRFVSFMKTSAEQIPLLQGSDTITYDANEWEGVKIAVRNLRNDFIAVTGNPNANILVATVGKSPLLEYDIDLKSSNVAIGILPTQDIYPERGLRLGVSIDEQPMQIIDARQGLHDEFQEYTKQNLAVMRSLIISVG